MCYVARSCRLRVFDRVLIGLVVMPAASVAYGQTNLTANSLAELRSYGLTSNNATVTLSATGGDPHPVTGIVTPGEYWLNGDHIANPTGSEPIFMDLSGTGNTYNLAGTTINVDTRDLDGYGRALGHGSGVHLIQLSGNNNLLQNLTLIGQDIALDTDPNAQRYADWGTQYVKLTGDNLTLDGATVVVRGSRTDTYGLSDAFGKGSSQGQEPYIGHRKAAGVNVDGTDDGTNVDIASNNTVTNLNLTMMTFGHGFFTGDKVSNTTLSNSTITGELFPSQLVIDRPEYQEHGHTWWGYPIQDNIQLSGSEGGVRTYGGTNFTVDNVVVDGMRTGFATVATGGDVTISNSYALNTTSGFDVGNNTTITDSGGNIVNGPLLVWYSSGGSPGDSEIELELLGGTPVGVNWSAFYVNGDDVEITLTSELEAGDLPEESYVRLGQKYFENWRDSDFNTATPDGNNPIPLTDSTFVNNTNQKLIIGENAEGNVGSSQAPVISNGKANYYDGVTLVEAGSWLVVQHEKGLGNSGTETGAAFNNSGNIVYNGIATEDTLDDNATIVEDGATLELGAGIRISDEKLTITGHGVDGRGALFSSDDDTRFGSSGGSNQSVIYLAGDASIGVEDVGDQLIVGEIRGDGDLIKRGLGRLALEKGNTFNGDLIIEAGSASLRSNGVVNGLTVANGASITPLGTNAYNTTGVVSLDGTMDLNGRSDENNLTQKIGSLNGGINGVVNISNPTAGTTGTLELAGDADNGQYFGTFEGAVNIIKSGGNTQAFDGTLTHTGTTSITGGTLLINGTHTGGDAYTVSGAGTLGGDGDIQSSVIVNAGGTLSPGNSPGVLAINDLELNTGAVLDLEIGGNLAGSGYDRITADTVTLGGDLNLSLLDLGDGLFEPEAGDSFLTLFATSLSGSFDNVASGERLETEGGEGSFVVTYGGGLNYVLLSSFESSASLAGDYNGDGFVSQADLDLVLLNWGTTSTPGGFDESAIPGGGPFDGLMSQNELDGVLLNWGDGAVPNLSAIPEPTAAGLLTLSGLMLARRLR